VGHSHTHTFPEHSIMAAAATAREAPQILQGAESSHKPFYNTEKLPGKDKVS